ncbi:MAG: energy transducer TonB [Vicinamibacteria bacterium]
MLRLAVVLLLLAMPTGAGAAVQDSLGAARDLYTTADYREALAMLTRLRPAATTPEDARAVDQYRAFALFALGQSAEAELVVEGMASIDPLWTLPAGEAPPRLATLFAQARERALPGVLRQRIAAARALYSEKRYDASAEAFTGVLLLLEDPALAKAAGADLQSMTALATGFRDLSLAADEQARAAAARPPGAPPSTPASTSIAAATPGGPETAPAAAPGTAPAEPAATPPSAPASTSTDTPSTDAATQSTAPKPTDIIPPVAIAQALPRATDATVPLGAAQTILLDIVIDETGRVERAEVRRSVNRLYEAQLVAATRGWRYTPATQAGRPVKYQRTLEVTLNPRD